MSLHVVILAAGKGSRMKSNLPKVLHPVGGVPMLQRVIDSANALKPAGIHIVIGHRAEQVQSSIHSDNVHWAMQSEQLGTGHAVDQALPNIPDDANILVLYGDVPLIESSTLAELVGEVDDHTLALLTAFLDDPTGYGRIIRDAADDIRAIVEQKDATEEQLLVQEINTGILATTAKNLKQWLPKLSSDNAQGEYYLTDIVEMAVDANMEVIATHPEQLEEVQGVNNRLQLCELECFFQSQQAEKLMLAGITLYDPNRIDVRGTLNHGQDIVVDLNCIFEGTVTLEDNVVIGPNCVIKNAHIKQGAHIHANSVIEDAEVGENANIGPFARLRPGTKLGANTKVGNFVETKKAVVDDGSKINHLSYVGDAVLGKDVNVGAGTITCNYDGVNKFKTELGDGVFVGSNSSLVAPVNIGDDATIGAGSVVTSDVKAQQLAVARGKQRNIDGWKRPQKQKRED